VHILYSLSTIVLVAHKRDASINTGMIYDARMQLQRGACIFSLARCEQALPNLALADINDVKHLPRSLLQQGKHFDSCERDPKSAAGVKFIHTFCPPCVELAAHFVVIPSHYLLGLSKKYFGFALMIRGSV